MLRTFSIFIQILLLSTVFLLSNTVASPDIDFSILERVMNSDGSTYEGESSNSEVIQANSHYYWSLSNSVLLYHRFLNNFYQLNPHSLAIRAPPIS